MLSSEDKYKREHNIHAGFLTVSVHLCPFLHSTFSALSKQVLTPQCSGSNCIISPPCESRGWKRMLFVLTAISVLRVLLLGRISPG